MRSLFGWTMMTAAAIALALAALFLVARILLAPQPGEWPVTLRAGPLQLQASVPALVRLATAPWLGPVFDGRTLPSPAGRVRIAWDSGTATLALRCSPCTVQPAGLGAQPLVLPELRLTAHRMGEQLSGELASGALRATWKGQLSASGLRLRLVLPMSEIADGYALFGAAIPELAQVRIEGRFALTAQLSLPAGTYTVKPQVEGFQVSGLGTEALVNARSGCTRRSSRVRPDSWLARAVVAAEDQRFFEHAGYDLTELSASLQRNQREGRAERGGSTLTQQLAKLLVTGGERSPIRKLRELLYAVEMEQTLGKARILRLYLAHAPWGPGLCGAEAAASHYFGRRAHELTPTQAAWLAAMLRNPALEVDAARVQWVLMGMRGMSRQRRIELAQDVE